MRQPAEQASAGDSVLLVRTQTQKCVPRHVDLLSLVLSKNHLTGPGHCPDTSLVEIALQNHAPIAVVVLQTPFQNYNRNWSGYQHG
mmetsp:Transcript_886/g.5552  ORF Transcript_886/g.5552 Transcript_886/m.5552 type:complete len:86 (-) Transcript_886:3294-3551(-)